MLYRASIDGFSAWNFHKKWKNKKPTLTLIKSSKGNKFGGYLTIERTGDSWEKFD